VITPEARRPPIAAQPAGWPALPYQDWRPTCDTLHAHTQVLGKLATSGPERSPPPSICAPTRR